MLINDEDNGLVVDDVPETSESEEQVETNASEEVDNVQDTAEEVVKPSAEELERQIEERANKTD